PQTEARTASRSIGACARPPSLMTARGTDVPLRQVVNDHHLGGIAFAEGRTPAPPRSRADERGSTSVWDCETGDRHVSQDRLGDGPCWDRTSDLGIKSPLLYQLS